MTKERRRIQYQICEALKAADYDKAGYISICWACTMKLIRPFRPK